MAKRLGCVLLLAACAVSVELCAQEPFAELVEREGLVEWKRLKSKQWVDATVGVRLGLQEGVRTGEFSRAVLQLPTLQVQKLIFMRVDEQTEAEIEEPPRELPPGLFVKKGGGYFYSREKAAGPERKPGGPAVPPKKPEEKPEFPLYTPVVTGGMRGTEFALRVEDDGRTTLLMLDGEVELSNAHGRLLLRSGEQAVVERGGAPRKTAVLEAVNIIQWALYYPGVLDPRELALTAAEERALDASLAAYRAGDLLGALDLHPAKTGRGGSAGARLYRAAVALAVGQVDKARVAMAGVPARHPGRRALEQVIAAVTLQEWSREGDAATAGEWLAESYYRQSRSDLTGALAAAREAVELAPDFGYARVRVAELEFSYGRTPQAIEELKRGLAQSPRNAQGHALLGFLLSAQNRIDAARRAFETAIALDGALGDAWLGRGLCAIRQGREEEGRRDLQIAAVLEPNRSILRSYLGKAFSQTGDSGRAQTELARARELDPNDPTPWLYSAIQRKQENRYNEAITDLEQSLTLNDNRRLYRSRFLLDQDRGVRGTNLAAIYLNNGMTDVSIREATRAVNADYSSASAHLFLANSYNALRDPRRNLLRYETPWFNELLLANLLAPVGGGPLSQFVSQQEYSKLFEADGLGFSSLTEYFSFGELRETASQYGTFGNLSYALDAEYLYNNGLRPNNEISRLETYGSFKLQLTPQDTLFFQTKYQDVQTGDLRQRYDQGRKLEKEIAASTLDFRERQEPALLLLGYHHEWNPGVHTLALFGRLANEQVLSADDTGALTVVREIGPLSHAELALGGFDANRPLNNQRIREGLRDLRQTGQVTRIGGRAYDLDYLASFEIYTGELNQIVTWGPQTLVLGGRYQKGYFETHSTLTGLDPALQNTGLFFDPPENADFTADFERVNFYFYDIWRVAPWLSITGGVTYDKLRYPRNYRSPPIDDEESTFNRVSPKFGFLLTPHASTVIRGAYTEAISGASFDESIRLEPTQVAGFNQAYRTIISEDVVGSIAGASYKTWGLSLEQKLPTRTYLGVEYNVLTQDLDQSVGVFDRLTGAGVVLAEIPSRTEQNLVYREDNLTASVNQLLGDRWSVGARYRYSKSRLRVQYEEIPPLLYGAADTTRSSILHQVDLFALYNHPSGFFARGEAHWLSQENDGYERDALKPRRDPRPGDDFWQLNAIVGWRFHRNQCEVSCGLLNLTGTDYQLEPLNYNLALPRDRTLFVRFKLTF